MKSFRVTPRILEVDYIVWSVEEKKDRRNCINARERNKSENYINGSNRKTESKMKTNPPMSVFIINTHKIVFFKSNYTLFIRNTSKQ